MLEGESRVHWGFLSSSLFTESKKMKQEVEMMKTLTVPKEKGTGNMEVTRLTMCISISHWGNLLNFQFSDHSWKHSQKKYDENRIDSVPFSLFWQQKRNGELN